ncbi:tetraacyldisaccharide 4'-kinase [soil metagenome]
MPTSHFRIEAVLARAWLSRGLLACLLWPLSLVFRSLVAIRRYLYKAGVLKSTRLRVPVVVVGNIFIGGTGKTPFVIWLVDVLRQAGYRPGVISRGHGSLSGSAPCLPQHVTSESAPLDVGDEPVLIAMRARCPVVVGRERVAAAQALLAAYPEIDVIVSDDGLQHYALARDVEIVLFDGRGAGNGWLLPAGPLREPVSRRRDFTVVNAEQAPAGMADQVIHMQLSGAIAERLSDRSQRATLTSIAAASGRPDNGDAPDRIVAAAGIGNPGRFFSQLRDAGLIFREMPLADHYDFSLNPFADLQADMILVTEKDAVKCVRIDGLKQDPRLWVVPVTAHIAAGPAAQILEKLRGCSTT